jgi:hypothetical protein
MFNNDNANMHLRRPTTKADLDTSLEKSVVLDEADSLRKEPFHLRMSKKDLLNKIKETLIINNDNLEDMSTLMINQQNYKQTPSMITNSGGSKGTLSSLPSVLGQTPVKVKGRITLDMSKSESMK